MKVLLHSLKIPIAVFILTLSSVFILSCEDKEDINDITDPGQEQENNGGNEPNTNAAFSIELLEPLDASKEISPYTSFCWAFHQDNIDAQIRAYCKYKLYLGKTNPPAFYKEYGGNANYIASQLEYLEKSTTYYWQVTSEYKSGFSETDGLYKSKIYSFTTGDNADLPVIKLNRVICGSSTDISDYDFAVLYEGKSSVTQQGLIVGTSPAPTLVTGEINKVRDLVPSTIYYIRAFAVNSYGVAYSNELSVKTLENGTVTDNEGRSYRTVKIGNRWWTTHNLMTEHYNNGDKIVKDLIAPEKRYAKYYGDEFINEEITTGHGRLYTYYTITDERGICPEGWRLPTKEDFESLIDYIGDDFRKADQLRSYLKLSWDKDYINFFTDRTALNRTGFSAQGAGKSYYRDGGGNLNSINRYFRGYLWSGDALKDKKGISLEIGSDVLLNEATDPNDGLSVRLVKDVEN